MVVPQQICAEEPPDYDVDDFTVGDFMVDDFTDDCELPTYPATGAVHAQPNRLKAHGGRDKKRPRKKRIRLDGYISNKLAALKECADGGDGISSAYIQIEVEGEVVKTKILRDGDEIDKIHEDGSFKVRIPFVRRRGTVYMVKLFAKSCDDDEFHLVDETYVVVRGKKKK